MLRILTAEQMREADRRTSEECGISGLILMENAAARVVETLEKTYAPLAEQRVLVVCGKGNNGGDGLAVARQLLVRRLAGELRVVLCADPIDLRGDAAANYAMLRGAGLEPAVVTDLCGWEEVRLDALGATVVVDALLGTGLKGAARGLAREVIIDLNRRWTHARFLAVDTPSGLLSERGEEQGEVMRAERTVTLTSPKPNQVLEPGASKCGELTVGRIGTPDELLEGVEGERLYLLERGDFKKMFQPRHTEGHKGVYGHVGVLGGSCATPGAVAMTGTAALRAGAGLVTVFTAEGAAGAVTQATPELMTSLLAEDAAGAIDAGGLDFERLSAMDVLALGPGLGGLPENTKVAERALMRAEQPVVLDADGLRALAPGAPRPAARTLVLTPHPGEMARLTGLSTQEVQADRVGLARTLAEERNAIVVLKGARTLIAAPSGRVSINPTGTPAMGTGGSGDVLTGMVVGLLAQFPDELPELVVAAAVYWHGLAGELAAERWGEKSLLATDILNFLPPAAARLQ